MLIGMPYDVWNFQMLAAAFSIALGVQQGDLVCFAGSMHYYTKNETMVPINDESRTVSIEYPFDPNIPTVVKWHILQSWAEDQSDVANWQVAVANGQPLRPWHVEASGWKEMK
jgi:hypothetical protein